MFGYNKIGHVPILCPRTGTYFQLLPVELWVKITDYYYGPLEIILEQYGNGIAHFTLNKYIRSKTDVDLLENEIYFNIPIIALTKYYKNYSQQGDFNYGKYNITWNENHTLILYPLTKLYLHDDLSQLFWKKINILNDVIKNAILSNNEKSLKHIRL